MTTPLLSLVIPARNEERYLAPLLESVLVATENFNRGTEAIEVVLVDNNSTDRTSDIGFDFGCEVVVSAGKSISAVRNAGAEVARGQILAWVDADSIVHPEAFNAIVATLTSDVVVGATGIRMSRSSAGIGLTLLVTGAVTRLLKVGSGVVFCRREDWAAVKGYDESRLYAEDVAFQADLKRLGRDRGQGFAFASQAPTISSARKFDQYGDWHAFGLVWHWMRGPRAFTKFVKSYWYSSR